MKKKFFDIILIATVSVLLFGIGTAIFLQPMAAYSENENKALANIKSPTPKNIFDGSFFSSVSDFYSDRFPLKSNFTALKAISELALGKGENNGIVFGKDGYLIPVGEYDSFDTAEENFTFFRKLEALAKESGTPFFCAIAPRSVDVMREKLPDGYCGDEGEIWEYAEGLEYISFTERLRNEAEVGGKYVWYMTDHHWTTEGAYIAYTLLAKELGIEAYGREYFAVETVSDSFYGTSYSSVGGVAPQADRVDIFRYEGDGDFTVTIKESGESFQGFYRTEALEQKDKYRIFLGGNYAELAVCSDVEGQRKNLLLIKDSYGNSIIPFLALHCDLTVIDARYYGGEYGELIKNADAVLLLHGIDTIATTPLR